MSGYHYDDGLGAAMQAAASRDTANAAKNEVDALKWRVETLEAQVKHLMDNMQKHLSNHLAYHP